MNLTKRCVVAAGVIAVLYGVGAAIQRGGRPAEIVMPSRHLADLPMQLGSWKGKDVPLDPNVFAHSGAREAVNREYRHVSGARVLVHTAIWSHAEGLPHTPKECYPGAGFRIDGEKLLRLSGADEGPAGCELSVQRDSARGYVLYWYQFGNTVVLDRDQLRAIHREQRGVRHWPAVVKVMIQTAAPNPAMAQQRLEDLGSQVFGWTGRLYPEKTGER